MSQKASPQSAEPRIFISYSRKDRLAVERLFDILKQNRFVPVADFDLLAPGADWNVVLQQALEDSDAMLLVWSPDAAASEWVQREWRSCLERQKPIIPVTLRQAPIPRELQNIYFGDLTQGINERVVTQLLDELAARTGRPAPKQWSFTVQPVPPEPQEAALSEAVEAREISDSEDVLMQAEAAPPAPPSGTGPGGTAAPPPASGTPPAAPETAAARRTRYQVNTLALSDKPADKDRLDFDVYAEALAGFILHPRTDKPLTVAIDAPWGMGKSSLMLMIRRKLIYKVSEQRARLRDERLKRWRLGFLSRLWPAPDPDHPPRYSPTPTVWFNAWKYDEEEALWAALALAVMGDIVQQVGFFRRLYIKSQLSQFDLGALLRDALLAVALLVLFTALGLLALVAIALSQGESASSAFENIAVGVALGGAAAAYQFGSSVVKGSMDLLNLKVEKYVSATPNYRERIGFLSEFEEHFKRLVQVVTRNGQVPLVIFIDDLDRCAVPKAAELVEAINVFLNTNHCVFVIGMDVRTVAASVEVRYEKLKAYLAPGNKDDLALGRRFLEKIVQINFPIPVPNDDAMRKFIRATLPSDEPTDVVRASPEQVEQAKEQVRNQPGEITSFDDIQQKVDNLELRADQQQVRQEVIGDTVLENFDNLQEVQDVLNQMVKYLGHNPRRVKRFINIFRLQAFIAANRGVLTGRDQLVSLGLWLEIAFRWPRFVEILARRPRFDDDLFAASATQKLLNAPGATSISSEDQLKLKKELEDYLKDPNISLFIEQEELIRQLPQTTIFSDQEIVHLLPPALQILASVPVREVE
ncbi:MAG: TIR domain-containing protein [Chloroflexi bacterium]|nr:TIR domain-containing protein [Chloroflexota bacterium]